MTILILIYKKNTISSYVKTSLRILIEVFKISEILYIYNTKINAVQNRKVQQAIT